MSKPLKTDEVTLDLNGKVVFTGQFLAIADTNKPDVDKWNWLQEQTKLYDGDLFHLLLETFFKHNSECLNPDEPEDPDEPIDPPNPPQDNCMVTELYGEFEFSLQPGYQTTKVFGLFTLKCEYESNTKKLKLMFVDLNPNLKRFVKLSVRRYDQCLTELFTTDLSNADIQPVEIDLSKYNISKNEHVFARIYYEIYGSKLNFQIN